MKKLFTCIFIATLAPLSYAQNNFNTQECYQFYNQKIDSLRSQRYSASQANRHNQRLRQLDDEKRGCANGSGTFLYNKALSSEQPSRRSRVVHDQYGRACVDTGTGVITCP